MTIPVSAPFAVATAVAVVLTGNFQTEFQLTGAIAGVVIVIVAGLFTIRAKNAEWWQQSYQGVKTAYEEEKARAAVLASDKADMAAKLAVLEARPDYAALEVMLNEMRMAAKANSDQMVAAIERLTALIESRLRPGDGP